MSDTARTRALIRFQWAAGARVSLRANAVVGATVVFLFGVFAPAPDPLATVRASLIDLVAPGHAWSSRLEFAAVCIALASVGVARVTLGITGWMRSLAATADMQRRAAIVALTGAEAFAFAIVVGAPVMTVLAYHAPLSVSRIATLPLIVVAAAMFVLPVKRLVARALAAVALIVAIPGTWPLAALSVVALAIADQVSGAIVPSRRAARAIARRRAARIFRERSSLVQWVSISWSALPIASVIGSALLPSVFVAFAYFIVKHNAHLPSSSVSLTVRICGSLAVASFVAALAQVMLRVRPSWAWARSLPWSSAKRVIADAVALGLPLCIVPAVLAPLAPLHALAVAATIPTIAMCGASALRGGASRQTGAAGEAFAMAFAAAVAVGVWPFAALPLFVVVPAFVRLGARRERRSRVTRWLELQHDAVGDPAWSGQR